MKNTLNPTYHALTEILEAAGFYDANDTGHRTHEILSIPMRAWASPVFKAPSGRTDHVAVIVFLDIVRRYLAINTAQEAESPILIDGHYYATDFRIPPKKLEATMELLREKRAIELCALEQKLWAVPRPEALAQAVLPSKVWHFYKQWSAWQKD